MILSNDDCVYPVEAPAPPCRNDVSDDNNNNISFTFKYYFDLPFIIKY